MKTVAIIGGGLSGLSVGAKLAKEWRVDVFEKARGLGGRMSTRYAPPFFFDHGSPYWTAQTEAFQHFLAPLMGSVVAEWKGNILHLDKNNLARPSLSPASYYVGLPHMNSLCTHLAQDCHITNNCTITDVQAHPGEKWQLMTDNQAVFGLYDLVISTAPFPQTLSLFKKHLPAHPPIASPLFEPCFSLMIGLNAPWHHPWIAAEIDNSPIQWIGVNSTKPGRYAPLICLVIHAHAQWTKTHWGRNRQEVQEDLLQELLTIVDLHIQNIAYISLHPWRYARVEPLNPVSYDWDQTGGLYALGDYTGQSDIETLWLNAQKMADHLLSNGNHFNIFSKEDSRLE